MNDQEKLRPFLSVATIFATHGFNLYLVGGSTRSFLLGEEINDFDCATNATVDDMSLFLEDANYVFAKFGTVLVKHKGHKFEITTLREEGKYVDFRHPTYIHFVKEIERDYVRRDFTINALYLDKELNVYDFCDGQKHLQEKKLVMIGDPDERLSEDPLRILRALRFASKLSFTLDERLKEAIIRKSHLLTHLNKEKITSELKKIAPEHKSAYNVLLNELKLTVITLK